ncbi:MAG: hypothetical protein ACO310_07705 [Burkholderiaceae bacterium]
MAKANAGGIERVLL